MSKKPFYLQGNFAPVEHEINATDLEVEGEIPESLSGIFLRNGGNPWGQDPGHWFLGDGMLHGVRLEGGKVSWYRNRYVDTACRQGKPMIVVNDDGTMDHRDGVSNTHVVTHNDKIFALVESSFPCEIDRELGTVGPHDFGGRLKHAFTAHPKLCPVTGEMIAFGYGFVPPFLTYHRVSADGQLVQSEPIEVPGSTMMHDFGMSENHVVFMDFPVVFKPEMAEGGMPYQWDPDYGARLGIMPRTGGSDDVKWVEVEPCFVFHPMNCYERDGQLVLDVVRFKEVMSGSSLSDEPGSLYRFTVDLDSGAVKEEALDDRAAEFPRVSPVREGLPNRYGYSVALGAGDGPGFEGLFKFDLEAGKRELHSFGANTGPSECVFVPTGEGEDEGVVMAYVYYGDRDESEFVLLDARNFSAEPIARVKLPQRVPYGFHGSWSPDPA